MGGSEGADERGGGAGAGAGTGAAVGNSTTIALPGPHPSGQTISYTVPPKSTEKAPPSNTPSGTTTSTGCVPAGCCCSSSPPGRSISMGIPPLHPEGTSISYVRPACSTLMTSPAKRPSGTVTVNSMRRLRTGLAFLCVASRTTRMQKGDVLFCRTNLLCVAKVVWTVGADGRPIFDGVHATHEAPSRRLPSLL